MNEQTHTDKLTDKYTDKHSPTITRRQAHRQTHRQMRTGNGIQCVYCHHVMIKLYGLIKGGLRLARLKASQQDRTEFKFSRLKISVKILIYPQRYVWEIFGRLNGTDQLANFARDFDQSLNWRAFKSNYKALMEQEHEVGVRNNGRLILRKSKSAPK